VTAQPRQPERRSGPVRSQPAPRQPAGGQNASGQPGGDRAGGDRAGGDRAGGDQAGGGAPAAEMPYEQARDELIEVVRRLEGGGLTLEESLKLWERGEHLAAICLQWLEGARARLAAALPEQADPGDSAAPF
jgi:exodeoxyribonuclease VII small subunit